MVIISEFLPNPIGKDTEGEWMKLFNNGDAAVDVSGWQIKDVSGKAFIFSAVNKKIIAGGETLTLNYKTTKITLNNNGETIFLYDKNGSLVDKVEYIGIAADGKVYIRAENGKFISSGSSAGAQETNSILSQTSLNNESANVGAIINNYNPGLNFSMGIFIALVLTALFIFISKKLELFSDNK